MLMPERLRPPFIPKASCAFTEQIERSTKIAGVRNGFIGCLESITLHQKTADNFPYCVLKPMEINTYVEFLGLLDNMQG